MRGGESRERYEAVEAEHQARPEQLPHQSDHQFSAALIPTLYPSSVQEILDLGLHGWAMSRYSGCWVGFKCVADTVESSSSVYIDPERTQIVVPGDFPLPRPSTRTAA